MAKMKTISITAKLDEKFKVEVKAGDRIMYVDQPKAAGGTDAGPNPLEYFFTSLAGCIATAARIIANQKRITLSGMEMKVEGEFDTETLLGKSTENRAGMTGIKVSLNIDSDMSTEEKNAFAKEIENRCPISDNIANTTPLTIDIVG
jgi:putative redox protein